MGTSGGRGAHALGDAEELQFVGDGLAGRSDDFELLGLPDPQLDSLALRRARLAGGAPVQDRLARQPEDGVFARLQHYAQVHELRIVLAGQWFVDGHVLVRLQLCGLRRRPFDRHRHDAELRCHVEVNDRPASPARSV